MIGALIICLICAYFAGVLLWYAYFNHRIDVLLDRYSYFRVSPEKFHRQMMELVNAVRLCWAWPIMLALTGGFWIKNKIMRE